MNPGEFAALVFVAVLFGAVLYRSKTTHFKCPACSSCFRLSSVSYIPALHILNKRYATCPHCGHSGTMAVVKNNRSARAGLAIPCSFRQGPWAEFVPVS